MERGLSAISTGRYGYPIEDAAYIAVQSIQAFEGSIDLVRLVAFDPDTFASYATLLR